VSPANAYSFRNVDAAIGSQRLVAEIATERMSYVHYHR
jgi:hypothetical protein